MELIKNSENYSFVESWENDWTVNGTVNVESNGTLSIYASVNSKLGDSIGNFGYSKPEEGNVNVHYDVSEDNRDTFTTYVDNTIDYIVEYFNK